MLAVIKIIFLLGFLIFIHELGHFTVAKLCHIKVNKFAIGFGPKVFKKKFGETEYSLRLLPLGGFVSMEGETEAKDIEGSFSSASVPKKIAVVLAGPTVNIVFAISVYFILMFNNSALQSSTIESLEKNYSAQTAGIEKGDTIKSINGKKVNNRYEYNKAIEGITNEELTIEVENKENQKTKVKTKLTKVDFKDIGIWISEEGKISAVGKKSSSSGKINIGDEIIRIDNNETNKNPNNIYNLIQKSKGDTIKIEILRNGENIEVEIIPNIISRYHLGVTFGMAEKTFQNKIIFATEETKAFILSIYTNLKEIFGGKVAASQMTGPVGISNMIIDTASAYEYIYLLALISLSLGVSNLLPIPGLDGGKFVILVIEAIRKKPLKPEIEAGIAIAGFTILISLSIYITYIDILRS